MKSDMPKILKSRSERQCSDTGRFIYFWTNSTANQLVRVLKLSARFTLFFGRSCRFKIETVFYVLDKTNRFLITINWVNSYLWYSTCPPGLTCGAKKSDKNLPRLGLTVELMAIRILQVCIYLWIMPIMTTMFRGTVRATGVIQNGKYD